MPEQPVALRLQSIADKIQGMVLKSDQMCLAAGESLGAALDGFGRLAGVFAALAQAFEGDDFKQAVGHLGDVTGRITAIGSSWSAEQGDLNRLIDLSHRLTEPIERLRSSIRTICAVTIYAKVEVRSIDTEGDDLNSFIEDLSRLANSSQSTIEAYWAEHVNLLALLQASRDAQAGFEATHQDRLATLTRDLDQSITTISVRRQRVSDSAGEISQRSQEISQAIGAVVLALQVGDATRQRIEHVKDGLEDIGAACAEPGRPQPALRRGAAAGGLRHKPTTVDLSAGLACRLQSRQTLGALEDFAAEMDRIGAALGRLAGQAESMVGLGASLYGSADDPDGSFLQTLKGRLDSAEGLIQDSCAARAAVDRVMASSLDTLTGLQQRVAKLSEIVVDMTLIGMNGILKSIRVGQQGKGLSVIAQELRNYANHAIEAANCLRPALQEMIGSAAVFEQRLRLGAEEGMVELSRSMAGALAGLQGSGAELGTALATLSREGAEASETLKRSAAAIGRHDDLHGALTEAAAMLDAVAEEFDAAAPDFPGEPIAAAFWSRYTMVRERDIHEDALGGGRPQRDPAPPRLTAA